MDQPYDTGTSSHPSEQAAFRLLSRVGMALEIAVQPSAVVTPQEVVSESDVDRLAWLFESANRAGIFVKEIDFENTNDAIGFLQEGYPLIFAREDNTFVIVDSVEGSNYESTTISDHVAPRTISHRELTRLIKSDSDRAFVAKKDLECDPLSLSPAGDDHHDDHEQLRPMQRFMALLNLERCDIWTVVLFAFVAGVLTLATPLAVEFLVNVVSWGIYLQPVIILGLILLVCLGIAGILRVLQMVVVEMILSQLSQRTGGSSTDLVGWSCVSRLPNWAWRLPALVPRTRNGKRW